MGGDAGVRVQGVAGEKPAIALPGGDAPDGLQVHDLIEGTGDPAAAGATVRTHYVGVGWDSARQFDASWDRGQSIAFPLSGVIAGWQEGIPGMRVGGRRLLVIPGAMAYGDRPPPGSGIGRDETLVFVIDLLAAG